MTNDWGPFTWNLFHTLSMKLKDEHFCNVKNELWDHFKNISFNLPCPICANHAVNYFKKQDIKHIKTKDQFIAMYFKFHNEVNLRLNKSLFSERQLMDKYKNENTIQVINIFLGRYKVAISRGLLFHKSLASREILSKFHNWIVQNIDKFNM